MRTFVAIEMDEDCRRNLATAVEQMEHVVETVKWVDPESAHLTLKFIGQLDEDDVPRAVATLQQAADDSRPFIMNISGISAFPSEENPRVIYAPIEEDDDILIQLANDVDARLADNLGVDRDERDFIPHITLGRLKKGKTCPPVKELAREAGKSNFGRVEVNEMVLMKSDLTPRGAVYTPLDRIALGT
ncbi:MAG: RNA 2',3'-cyclic phosphodiesterase [Planctomycetota bacterium]